jgi:hypothetical protein
VRVRQAKEKLDQVPWYQRRGARGDMRDAEQALVDAEAEARAAGVRPPA